MLVPPPANMSPKRGMRKLAFGILALLIGLMIGFFLIVHEEISRWFRVGLFFPFLIGMLGVYQYFSRTDIYYASHGIQDLDGVVSSVDDPIDAALLKRQARGVKLRAFLMACLWTILTVLIPSR